MKRRIIRLTLIGVVICILLSTSILALTPLGTTILTTTGVLTHPTPTPTPIVTTPTPTPTPQPILTARGPAPQLDAASSYLLDADTGHTLSEEHGEKPMLMASTTKIMTALIAIQTADPDRPIPVHQDAINRVIIDDGSSAGLVEGDVLPLKDMLYALMLPSGNDAAYAIADELGGTNENFVQRMNLFALRLHLFQTHFNSPDGLTADNLKHYTTAHDLAILSRYAMSIPRFAQIVHTETYTAHTATKTLTWTNTNKLLWSYSGMTGIKTGHTDGASYCLVFSATRSGHHLIGVILGDSNEAQRNQDAAALLDWGFHLPMLAP